MAAEAADLAVPSDPSPGGIADPRTESARAKVNLWLHVTGRRADDGYHTLESLFVFTEFGDDLTLTPGDGFDLVLSGPMAGAAGEGGDNLVLKAARALADEVPDLRGGTFTLDKRTPVAAGLGGGSADAAAALRLLARENALDDHDPRLMRAALRTGADVPVCLASEPAFVRGIGDILSPIAMPDLALVLVNPGVPLSTAQVFAALGRPKDDRVEGAQDPDLPTEIDAFAALLGAMRNDLEPAAVRVCPPIASVLEAIGQAPGVLLARMSGSGPTCFGLFGDERAAETAAASLSMARPGWWVRAVRVPGA